MDILEIEAALAEKLNKHRYQHTLGVSFTSAALAMCYGCDIKKAQVAGLLHDCAKYLKGDELLKAAREYSLPVNQYEEKNPSLLHGKVGAYFASQVYGENDTEILSAITWHTTGKPDMSLLDKIVFIADYIEPGRRDLPGLSDIRRLAYTDIDKAVLGELKSTVDYLRANGTEIDPATLKTMEFYEKI